ncbi:MAG: glycosyltransferase family 39 protein [Alphaproteobacteria bacterium]|nr:glycosyltransferase family 39 protein [Alphaproteobacteria bacterium]
MPEKPRTTRNDKRAAPARPGDPPAGDPPAGVPAAARPVDAQSAEAQSAEAQSGEGRSAWRTALAVVLGVTAFRLFWLTLGTPELYADEAQYWVWAQDLSWGYYTKPPLIAWLIAGTTALCGQAEGCVRLSSPVLHAATALLLFVLGRRLYGPRAGLFAAILWTTLPAVWISGTIISTDVPVLAAWAFALLAVLKLIDAAEAGRPAPLGWWAGLGAALGLGMLAKYVMAAFLPGLALFLLWHRPARAILRSGWRGPLAGLAAMALFIAPNLAWNLHNSFATIRHVGQNANLGGALLNPRAGAEFFAAQFAVFGPLLFGFLLFLLAWRPRATLSDWRARFLASFILPLGLLILGQSFLSRANANWAAPVYVAAVVLVAAAALAQGRQWLLRASVALHVAIALLVFLGPALAEAIGRPLPRGLDPFARMRGGEALGREVSRHLAADPRLTLLAERRREMATLMYYVRPYPAGARMWEADGVARNQFELDRAIAPGPGPWLLVTHREAVPDIAQRFGAAERVGRVRIVTHPNASLTYTLFRLADFAGTPAGASPAPR